MAQILFVSSGRTSLLNRCVELIRRLEAVGHETTFAGPEDRRALLEGHGIRFAALDTRPAPWTPPEEGPGGLVGKATRWVERWRSADERRRTAAAALVDPAYPELLATVDPDLVLIDVELQPYVIVTHGRARTAILCPFIAPRKVAGVPPLHMQIRPGAGFAGTRLGIELAWARYRTWKAWQHWRPRIAAPGSDRIAQLRELAEQSGFPHRREFALYDWLFPMSFESVPVLNLNAIELDFPHTPHPSQHHTGPLIRLDRRDALGEDARESAAAVEALLRTRDATRPLVLCAFGTAFAGDDSAFIARLLDAVASRPDWDVIVTLGGRTVGSRPEQLPGHVRLFDWVPQLAVLEQAACAVLHAGPGSIYECVHFGVPMVLFPFRVNDQLGYAARAEFHELGIVGDRDADDAATIRSRIEDALSDPRYRTRVQAMNDAFRRYEADRTAVRVVEALLSDGV